MKIFFYSLIAVAAFSARGLAEEHDKSCKNIHGKVTVVTEKGISVDDKLYTVGKTTRITKGEKVVKLSQISAGDIVCIDVRGKNDIGGGEVAAVTVFNLSEPVATREKQYVREKETTIRRVAHDKNCNHVHGKIAKIEDSVVTIDGKPYALVKTTKIVKGDQVLTIEKIKTGDFVCLDEGDAKETEHKVTTVMILNPTEAAPFETREVIREREKIREEK
jgi:hypothetical protein